MASPLTLSAFRVFLTLSLSTLSAAYTWNFAAPPQQCSNLTVSVGSGGTPPYSILVLPFGPSPLQNGQLEDRRILNEAFPDSSTTVTFELKFPANSQFVGVVSDSSGLGSGGTSAVTTVTTSSDDSCLTETVAPAFTFAISSQIAQCQDTTISWSSTAQGTPNFTGVIPGGQLFAIPESDITNAEFTWTPSISAGTTFVLVAGDSRGIGSGGSASFVVGAGDNGCLSDTSPSSTAGNPPGGIYSSTTSSTSPSQTSTTSASSSSSIAASSTSTSSTSPMSSGTQSPSPVLSRTQVRDVAISVSIVGTFLALLVFLLWRFCNRRRDNDRNGDIDPITSQYHPVPTAGIIDSQNGFDTRRASSASMRENPMFASGSDANVTLKDNNSASISDDLKRPPIVLNYRPVISSNNGPSSPLSPLRTPATPNRLSTHSMTTDNTLPVYSRIPILDGSNGVASPSENHDINEKSRNTSPISRSTVAESQDESLPVSTATPEKHEENVWESGYPQPLKFIPII